MTVDERGLCIYILISAEAAIALRQRLNETVESLDVLRKQYNELSVKFESQNTELTVAKSDRACTLALCSLNDILRSQSC